MTATATTAPRPLTTHAVDPIFVAVLVAVLVASRVASGQTAAPMAAQPALGVGNGCQVDLPAGWTNQGNVVLFRSRTGSALRLAFHVSTAKQDALPYAILEAFSYPTRSASITAVEQQAFADQVASFYTTSVVPPARADTPNSWTRATVTPAVVDATNRRFTYEAKISYADRPGTYHVHAAGVFGLQEVYVLSVWSDDAALAAHRGEVDALRDGFRLSNPAAFPMSVQDRLMHFARVGGALVLVAIVAIQLYALWRERRDREAEVTDDA